MFRINYKVTGEDVNDFMVMQNEAYFSYSISAIKNFLHEKGIPSQQLLDFKNKLINQKQLEFYKDLMFTQNFFIHVDTLEILDSKTTIKNRFFNSKNELCAAASIIFENYTPMLNIYN